MNEEIYNKNLEKVSFYMRCDQSPKGIHRRTEKDWVTEKLYIHQIIIKRDIKDRYEQLYSIKYDDYIFNETKIIENKTFAELVNFMDKQKIATEKSFIEDLLSYSIINKHDKIVNGIPFVVKEKVDFEKEGLPRRKNIKFYNCFDLYSSHINTLLCGSLKAKHKKRRVYIA